MKKGMSREACAFVTKYMGNPCTLKYISKKVQPHTQEISHPCLPVDILVACVLARLSPVTWIFFFFFKNKSIAERGFDPHTLLRD